jgi:Domain of unknown function (DUF892)
MDMSLTIWRGTPRIFFSSWLLGVLWPTWPVIPARPGHAGRGAAQRVEHYEIAAYTTARNLALQLRQPVIVQLLTMSLGEEQNAGQLLDQVAQPLMSVARMPASVEFRRPCWASYLGRYHRRAGVVDAGESRAALIPESHNFPGFNGVEGPGLLTG